MPDFDILHVSAKRLEMRKHADLLEDFWKRGCTTGTSMWISSWNRCFFAASGSCVFQLLLKYQSPSFNKKGRGVTAVLTFLDVLCKVAHKFDTEYQNCWSRWHLWFFVFFCIVASLLNWRCLFPKPFFTNQRESDSGHFFIATWLGTPMFETLMNMSFLSPRMYIYIIDILRYCI